MSIRKQILLLSMSTVLAACTSTGLGSTTAETPEVETETKNYTEEELNAMLEPEVTRGGTLLTYRYDGVTCGYGTVTPNCTNIDLKEDAESTNNQTSYYMLMNRKGKCLSSTNDQVKVTSCNVFSDYQHFRLSYKLASPREISVGGNTSLIWTTNAYMFAMIPKKNYKGDSQSYDSGEKYWLKKKNSENKIQQGDDCNIGNDKCAYRFYDATQWDSTRTYTMTNPDGSTTSGEYFFIQNHKFAQHADAWTAGKYYCLKEDKDKLKVALTDEYLCQANRDKMLWRLMKVTITETPIETNQAG